VIGLDTNVLVRYIAQDDKAQSARATSLIENECSTSLPGYVGLIVLVEVVWVSEACYGATRRQIAEIVRRILGIRQFVVQDTEVVWQALRQFENSKADFADCLIERAAAAAGCVRTLTFDKRAGMTLLQ
jgi:predicted nucleic-acid-binding protein